MLVRNENFQETELSLIVNDILKEYEIESDINISEEEVQTALAQMVFQSNLEGNRILLKNQNYAMPIAQAEFLRENIIKDIWKRLQNTVCPKFDEKTEQEKIAEIVAEAIANLLPYKIIIKPLLKIVLFYVLKHGHSVVCKIEV